MLKQARKLYDSIGQKIHSKYAPLWLLVAFILEIFLFIPLDALLMLFCLQKPKFSFLYAFLAALGSVVGGALGFFVGCFLWDAIGEHALRYLLSPDLFHRLAECYKHYQHIALWVGAFLPLPFKVVTLSAGFCQLEFWAFLFVVGLARFVRFFLVVLCMRIWGQAVKEFVDKHFHRIFLALGAKVAVTLILFWILS